MTTKPTVVGVDRGIYSSPFDAFTNYMNILGDFINRVNNLYSTDIDNDELEGLLTTIKNQGDEIEMKDKEISRLQAKIEKIETESDKFREKVEGKESSVKTITRKSDTKKAVKDKIRKTRQK
jgi:alpha-amylase